MEDPNTANRLTLHRLYRAPGVPQTARLITVIGLLLIIRPELLTGDEETAATLLRVILTPLTLLNALAGAAAAWCRINYRHNPYCPICGQDVYQCKYRRDDIFPHRQPPNGPGKQQ